MARKMPRKETWADEAGQVHYCLSPKTRIDTGRESHALLRAFIFRRDGFVCQKCSAKVAVVDPKYNGRTAPYTTSKGMLILARRVTREDGGTLHPRNLQTLCEVCAANKLKNRNTKAARWYKGALAAGLVKLT